MASRLEAKYQADLKRKIKAILPGSIVVKLDPTDIQGIPDLAVFYNDRWATLECKRESGARLRPNQGYYVGTMNMMSFSRFIYPEVEEEVLDELQHALRTPR